MADTDPADWSLARLSRGIRAREISCVEATEAALTRAQATQPATNAFLAFFEEKARVRAKALDAELDAGHWRGPLHGIPLAHKDCLERTDEPMTVGSRVFDPTPGQRDATVLMRLDAAGAVDIGRLQLNEMVAGPTGQNPHFGDCRNPWDPTRISGGSSSGSGAAVAAGAVAGSLGSDTGGSIRLPAAMNGLFGLKPTYGRVSRAGCFPRAFTLDCVGPLTRTAEDNALMLAAVAGPDPRDLTALDVAVPDYAARLATAGEGSRLAVIGGAGELHADVSAAFMGFLAAASEAFGGVAERPFPGLDTCYAMGDVISKVEAATIHGRWMEERGERYSQAVFARTEPGLNLPATRYAEALILRGRILADFLATSFAEADVLLCPTVPLPTPTRQDADMEQGERVFPVVAALTRLTRPFSYLGLPVLSMPIGLDANGMPVGAQLIGRPFGEARLLAVADRLSRDLGWSFRPGALRAAQAATNY